MPIRARNEEQVAGILDVAHLEHHYREGSVQLYARNPKGILDTAYVVLNTNDSTTARNVNRRFLVIAQYF